MVLEVWASRSSELAPSMPAGTLSLWRPRRSGQVAREHRGLSFADLLQKKSIGAKEDSSFAKESTKNPIVFQPPSQALPGDPVSKTGPHENLREIEALQSGNFWL